MKKITSLAYSAGVQSHILLEMILRCHIDTPKNFVVINANPGMEDERTLEFVARSRQRCQMVGIPFITAQGPNLFDAMTSFQERGVKRIDNPPYWTRNRETGKIGRLKQKCTREFKIRPMRRALRQAMFDLTGTRKVQPVETWIGFGADEQNRAASCKSDVKYISLRFPLIEMGLDRAKVEGYYLKHSIPKPPRSVCVACFANGLAHFEDMYLNRPDDWDKAVQVDDSIRDMCQVGIKDECFVSASMVPLKELPDRDFLRGTKEGLEHRCNSGVCFV